MEEEALVMARPKKYPDELVARGVRLALESGRPIAAVARDLGMHPETLRKRVRQVQADEGLRPDLPSTAEREKIRAAMSTWATGLDPVEVLTVLV